MADEIPQWAIRRARELFEAEQSLGLAGHANRAFARYIMEHEEPPVDPLLIEARAIAADSNDERGFPGIAESYRAGADDNSEEVRLALAALRRGIELGKAGEA